MSKTVIIADDHPVFLLGLHMVLNEMPENYQVRSKAHSADQLLAQLENQLPDMLITDLNMPGDIHPGGLRMIKTIRTRWPNLPIVVITMINEPNIVSMLLHYKVKAILNKTSLSNELIKGLHSTAGQHEPYISPDLRSPPEDHLSGLLTPKELEVIRLLGRGLTVNEIALKLYRTKQTISTQKQSAMRKLNIQSTSALYRYLQQMGLDV